MINTDAAHARTAASLDGDAPRPGRVAALVAGDVISFAVFTIVGLASHKETETVSGVVTVAAPFIIAWLVVAPPLGAFGRRGAAATTTPARLLPRTALSWAIAWPVAMVVRGLVFHGGITAAFATVALVVNAVFLVGWRGIAAALFWRR